jgi:two-component system, NarL family, nitrate/nitrite response regulator NarL
MAPPLRVLVISEDPLARSGLVALVSSLGDLTLAGQGAPEEAAALSVPADADVVLWDAGGEAVTDLEALSAIIEAGAAVVVLAGAEGGRAALSAGARGLLARDLASGRLSAALQAVAQGLVVLDDRLPEGAMVRRPAGPPLVEPLTPRETEVLHLLGQGLSNRGIAERLAISEHTAKFHVNAILGKLGAQSRAEAVAQGVRLGLLLL